MVTGGNAVALEVGPLTLEARNTYDLSTKTVASVLKNQKSDNMAAEYRLIMSTFARALNDTMHNVWYIPSQGASFSNFMSWFVGHNHASCMLTLVGPLSLMAIITQSSRHVALKYPWELFFTRSYSSTMVKTLVDAITGEQMALDACPLQKKSSRHSTLWWV
jgi:hypothetical protein